MREMKKFVSLVLALVLAFALAAPAFADGDPAPTPNPTPTKEKGSITINNASYKQEYNAYLIFDLESYVATENPADQANAPHSYKVNDAWKDFINQDTIKGVFVSVDDSGYVTWVEKADVAEFAKKAIAYASTNNISATKTETTGEKPVDAAADTTSVTFSDLDLGYYLVSSTVGTLCALDTTNKDVTIKDKNEKPTIEKTTTNNTENTQRVGEDIEYQVVVHAKKGALNYVLTDTMGTGLKFNQDSIVVKSGETPLKEGTDYTVSKKSDDGFTLKFTNAYLDGITEDTRDITVTYSAKITAAAISEDTIKNDVVLKFGDPDHTEETEHDKVESKVFKFNFVKHNSKNEPLPGAVFSLHTDNSCTDDNRLGLVAIENAENSYRVATDEDVTGIVYTVTTPADGKITIEGLGNKTYYLKEVTPPTGYNALKDPVTVEFKGANIETSIDEETGKWTGIAVLNQTGAELPSTGGIGTTIFYVVGGILVVGAAILLVTRKRVSGEK